MSDEIDKAIKSSLCEGFKLPDIVGLHLAETSSTLASHFGRGGGEADGEGVDFICQRQISFYAVGIS